MKGWKTTDDTRYPYYYPGTSTQYQRNKRCDSHQTENNYQRSDIYTPSMTQLEYYSSNGMYSLEYIYLSIYIYFLLSCVYND